MTSRRLPTLVSTTVFAAVLVATPIGQADAYRAEVEAFRAQREAEISGPTGWGALVGLHFLTHGTHTIGRDEANDVVLAAPSAPARLGRLAVGARGASIRLATDVDARVKGHAVGLAALWPGTPADDGLVVDGMTMIMLRRGGRLALRVWDARAPVIETFTGLKWSPIDPAWRIDARFVAEEPEVDVPILNVLDELVNMRHVGYAEFEVAGQPIRLLALKETLDAEELFFIFRDGTSGRETYEAGRYLYTPLPKDGRVTLDFNKAKNPPCTFTDYATCPLPPAMNRLALPVRAGELSYNIH